jgi:hypothetical protein
MPAPDDAADVLAAVRLGWYVAEVRGRYRPGPQLQNAPLPPRADYPLPLEVERSPAELRSEAQGVLGALAVRLEVDVNRSDQGSSFSGAVDSLAKGVAKAYPGAAADSAWNSLAELFYKFDAHIQDTLAAQSATMVYGYRLGRALAECYWALDPAAAEGTVSSWSFLLGPGRSAEMGRLSGRLSAYFHPNTAAAIAGSVKVWESVAASPGWRLEAHPAAMYQQMRRWHELVMTGLDPMIFVRPYERLRNFSLITLAVRFFWPQLILTIVGAIALVTLVIFLGSGTGSAVVNTVLGILAAAGISTAGLSAGRFRQNVNTDMAALAITTAPPPPTSGPFASSRQKAQMAKLVRHRDITTS